MIPTVETLASSPLPVRYGDVFNPPGLTNFLGAVQVDRDVVAVRNVNFPPLFGSDVPTGKLFVDGEYVEGTAGEVTFTWRPDRVVRRTEHAGLVLTSTTIAVAGSPAVVVRLEVANLEGEREVELRLKLDSLVSNRTIALRDALPPSEIGQRHHDADRGAVMWVGTETGAACIQGVRPHPTTIDRHGVVCSLHLGRGATGHLDLVIALGADADEARATFDRVVDDVDGQLRRATDEWNAELAAVVTPGNDRYSGHLPVLETADEDLLRLYWTGILGVVMFKRETPASVVGRTYDTLMPRYWPTITFLWDYSLSGTVHALLDPAVMRRQLEHWIRTDIHTCMGTSWLTGEGVGMWYAVNDYAMTRTMHDFLRWTGELSWLDREVATPDDDTRRVVDELVTYARSWRKFATPNGLADYGGIGNLLECVSTYVHEVASLNAANVFNLRVAADVLSRRGEEATADELRAEATELVTRIQELYVDGGGFWYARDPSGHREEVRHAYDLLTVLYALEGDLPATQRDEMVAYFDRELRTDGWLRALSNRDLDATFSVRADHQWNGAYTAWPSEIVRGLYRIGEHERAASWLRGMAASANQGPFGQAHFAESVIPPHAGGARKVPPELPYINDWACSSGGSWTSAIIEGVFGVDAGLDGVTARPHLDGFDPEARLVGLRHHGVDHVVDAGGVHRVEG